MNIGILGAGVVGQTIGSKLVQLGHTVMLGSREGDNPKAVVWAKQEGHNALFDTFATTAAFGEIIFNCTLGAVSMEILRSVRPADLKGKIIVDTANPLDYAGEIWTLTVCNTDSLGEQIQREFPDARVVKTLNTVYCDVMVDPAKLLEKSDVFVSGNSADAKATVTKLLRDFGWRSVIDLGDISTSRGVEMYVMLWRNLRHAVSSHKFNIRVVTGA